MTRNVFGASARTSMLARGLAGKVRDKFDGLFRTRMVPHHATNELLVTRTQPSRNAILEHVKRVRIEDVTRPLSFGAWALTIPFEDLEVLQRANPDLNSPDATVRNKAWRKFIQSPESMPYRVKEKL